MLVVVVASGTELMVAVLWCHDVQEVKSTFWTGSYISVVRPAPE
jgi:hypothetical protein